MSLTPVKQRQKPFHPDGMELQIPLGRLGRRGDWQNHKKRSLTPLVVRIKQTEIDILKKSIRAFDPDARIYLFGSRTNDRSKGGDLDILVLSDTLTFQDKLKIKARIFEKLEEQLIHLVIAQDQRDPFIRHALNLAVPI